MILVLGKARSCRALNLGWGGGHLDDLMFLRKTARDAMHEWMCCCDEAANHQLLIAAAVFIILHLPADKEH